jgi:hypothetical protein
MTNLLQGFVKVEIGGAKRALPAGCKNPGAEAAPKQEAEAGRLKLYGVQQVH